MKLGKKIKALRKLNNFTQQQVADLVYVTRGVVSMWETELRNPNVSCCLRLCKLFKITPNDLFLKDPK